MPSSSVLRVVGAAIVDEARCLVAQRSAAMAEPLRWEFPGGKVEPGETPEGALAREVREELGIEVEVGPHLGRGEVASGGRVLRLDVYEACLVGGADTMRLAEHRAVRWIGPTEIESLDWAEADVPVLDALAARLRRG